MADKQHPNHENADARAQEVLGVNDVNAWFVRPSGCLVRIAGDTTGANR